MARNDKPTSDNGAPAQADLEVAPAALVKVKVAPGHSLSVSKPLSMGFHPPLAKPGDIVEVPADEAKRLKARGVVIDADAELPKRADGLNVQSDQGPRIQGPDFSRKA